MMTQLHEELHEQASDGAQAAHPPASSRALANGHNHSKPHAQLLRTTAAIKL